MFSACSAVSQPDAKLADRREPPYSSPSSAPRRYLMSLRSRRPPEGEVQFLVREAVVLRQLSQRRLGLVGGDAEGQLGTEALRGLLAEAGDGGGVERLLLADGAVGLTGLLFGWLLRADQ